MHDLNVITLVTFVNVVEWGVSGVVFLSKVKYSLMGVYNCT